MLACLIASALAPALSSCGRPESAGSKAPPAADLIVEAEPQLDMNAVSEDSAAALDDYDTAHASWGRRGWAQVARICRFFRDLGMPTPDCDPPNEAPDRAISR
jgi:hypothetical protein